MLPSTLPIFLTDMLVQAADRGAALVLFEQALTHPSYSNERRPNRGIPSENGLALPDNQRLELLGDAVMEMIITHCVYDALPRADEGLLSRVRAAIVNDQELSEAAKLFDLGAYLRLGRGEQAHGGRDKTTLLADAFEAVVAAIYLGVGLSAARDFVLTGLASAVARAVASAENNSQIDGTDTRVKHEKNVLQEVLQRGGGESPSYELLTVEGNPPDQSFTVRVLHAGSPLAEGRGRTRKDAEMMAARQALEVLAGQRAL